MTTSKTKPDVDIVDIDSITLMAKDNEYKLDITS